MDNVDEFPWLDASVKEAVRSFWKLRDGGLGVQGGKTLDLFVQIIARVVHEAGLAGAEVFTGRNTSQVPGFFRPHKSWDVVVINKGSLLAAIELKSQVGSIGNNFNNRTEEVLGSSIDLKTAIEEAAFGESPNIFTGYIIVVEKSEKTLATPRIGMTYFPVMEGFLLNEELRESQYVKDSNGKYPGMKGVSYLSRYDIMCQRLMMKGLYTSTALVAVPNRDHDSGLYDNVSPQTSIKTFLTRLSAHCHVVSVIEKQTG